MTRKSRVRWQVEAFEPRVLLDARPTLVQPLMLATTTPAGVAPPIQPLLVSSATPGGVSLATPTTGPATATVGDPTAPVVNTLAGTYRHAGRSLAVDAEGTVAALGPVQVSGSITVSGPRRAQDVSGLLTLTGSAGSITLQLAASRARNVIGDYGPVKVTETVVGATGAGAALQGESGSGPLTLGRWAGASHRHPGGAVAAHGSFWMFVGLKAANGDRGTATATA